ncbi:hypothetical protein M5689_017412 [Euphorbia peplus]|nr:hypothetical protein M5689_017412 [Euphorbia peplus]
MHIVLDMRRSNSIIDLESGRNLDEDHHLEVEKLVPKFDYFRRTGSLNSIGMLRICGELNSNAGPLSSTEKLECKQASETDTSSTEEKKKRIAKPPRPPKAPILNMADMKLLREMTELAKLKRARAQRIKDLKKVRKENASSVSINILPLLVTIVFFFVIIFQGLLGARV